MFGPMMQRMCRAVVRRLDGYLDGELPPLEMMLIRAHLRVCERCGPRYRFEKALLEEIRKKSADLRAPASLTERVSRLIRERAREDR